MQLDHPLNILHDWLVSQPEEIRSTTAVLAAPHLSESRFSDFTFFVEEPASQFEEWLLAQCELKGRTAVAKILTLREIIQFFVIDHFGNEDQWKQIAKDHTVSISEFEEEGYGAEITEPLEHVVRSTPFRRRLWAKTAKSWGLLVNDALSNEQLRVWLLVTHEEA
mgnify:CR=1 FL=1